MERILLIFNDLINIKWEVESIQSKVKYRDFEKKYDVLIR